MAGPELRDDLGEQVGRDGGDHAESERPRERVAELAHAVGEIVGLEEQPAQPRQDRLAGRA